MLRGVAVTGTSAGDVEQQQADRAAHGRVRPVARSERPDAAVEPAPLRDLAVHDEQRRDRMSGCVHAPQVELRAGECTRRGDEHRHDVGRAAGEHSVDCDHPAGRPTEAWRQHAEHLVGMALGGGEHRLDAVGGGWHQREPVAPAPRLVEVHEGLGRRVCDIEELGRRRNAAVLHTHIWRAGIHTCVRHIEW